MKLQKSSNKAFSLLEVMVGIGMAGALVLLIMLLSTTALKTDQKVSDRQIAAAVAQSQLDRLTGAVSIDGSPARLDFWSRPDGPYSGAGIEPTVLNNGTEFSLSTTVEMVTDSSGSELDSPFGGNRLRQVTLVVRWWSDEKSRPGYGDLSIQRTRVLRESNVRKAG